MLSLHIYNTRFVDVKAQDTAELFFENVRVHKSQLLGKEGSGFPYLMTELPQERLLIAVNAIANAEACFEWTRTFVKERKAFGSTIASLQTVKHKMATLKYTLPCVLYVCMIAHFFLFYCIVL